MLFLLGLAAAQANGQTRPAATLGQKKDPVAEMGFERHLVAVNDAKLSYVVRKGSGPTLVLIPGSFDSAESWLVTVSKLDKDLQVVVVELRGHGQSWPPPDATTGNIEQFAKDVFACTDDAGLKSFYVGGHSIGGMVAIECAWQQPDRLRGVLSIEGWTRALVLGHALKGRTDNTLTEEQKKRKFDLRRPTTSRWTNDQLTAFARIWEHWDGTDVLEKTALPVLELWGDRGDELRPTRKALLIPDRDTIDLVWVPGASHFLPLERPEAVAAAATDFIRKVEVAGRK